MKKGFTIVEILVALVIVAAMAAMLIPRAAKTKQKGDQRRAESSLRAIRIAQKMFYARNGLYACSTACASAAAINTALGGIGIAIRDGTYVFSMTSGSATTFTATADTTGTANDITLDQAGAWTKGGSPYTPP